MRSEPISLFNTALPLLVLAGLAVAVPYLLVPGRTRRQWEVMVGIWASAGFLLLAGAGVFAAVYAISGVDVIAAFRKAPLATGWFFLKVSGTAAVLWVPILGLSWLWLAQRVERRKGEDGMRGGQ